LRWIKSFSVQGYKQAVRQIPLEVVMLGKDRYAIYDNINGFYLPQLGGKGRMEVASPDLAYKFINALRPRSLEPLDDNA
jgi:hypothetical protein